MATSTTASSSFKRSTLSHAQKSVLAMSRAQYLEAIRATRPADKLYVGVCIFRMDAHSSRPSVLLLRRSDTPEAAPYAKSPVTPGSPTTTTTTTIATTTTTTTTSTAAAFSTSPYSRWRRQHHKRDDNGVGREVEGEGEYWTRRNGGMWELPGGKVRDGDFCISAAVAGRVAEQTGLRVVRVLGALQDVRRVAEVRILDWDDDGVGIFTAGGRGSGNLSVLDGATLTSGTGSPGSGSGSFGGSSGYGYGSGSGNGSSSGWNGGAGGIGGRGGVGGSRGSSSGSSQSRRSPIHNPQLVLRKEYLQLNYAVLVQNHDDLAVKSPEHDGLVWASFSRAEALPMPEELRTVVHQGLAFAGEYLF
ncbi:hypothetical protein F5Y00DRAFT_247795 [Daldinia vernicosa]|uniref:uncharacterized protein n=1 Tax=Daldinia vernicosa TaxID=114800 RepID=UPI002008112A|nr:uncharacterized protein F5Y00DRAFT_247795 [Daldinia vernicosa]KAI0844836.1 hypothetical protein F5Y00DRAFT_247795 [Daldinia vernicosa]